MQHDIQLTVNGIPRNLTVTADDTLLRVLREELHLTGAKKGCGEGECGACTIIMNGEAIRACLVLAVEANGADILTIEGITPPNGITRVQQAFIEADAVQCGFCTPGFVMALEAELRRNPRATAADLRNALGGHLCRCTGYEAILQVTETLAASATRPKNTKKRA